MDEDKRTGAASQDKVKDVPDLNVDRPFEFVAPAAAAAAAPVATVTRVVATLPPAAPANAGPVFHFPAAPWDAPAPVPSAVGDNNPAVAQQLPAFGAPPPVPPAFGDYNPAFDFDPALAQQLPAFGAHAFGAPAFGAPAFGAPFFGAHAFGAHAFDAPAFGAHAFGARPNDFPLIPFEEDRIAADSFDGLEIPPLSALQKKTLRDWFRARAMLLNGRFADALRLARRCRHPDAAWLCTVLEGTVVHNVGAVNSSSGVKNNDSITNNNVCNSAEHVVQLLREHSGESDARRLCLEALLSAPVDTVLLQRAATLGEPLARFELGKRLYGAQRAEQWSLAAARHEPEALFAIGDLQLGDASKFHIRLAAELGHAKAMETCALKLLDKDDPKRYIWLGELLREGRASRYVSLDMFMSMCDEQIQLFAYKPSVVFALGQALSWNKEDSFGWFNQRFQDSVEFFNEQQAAAKKAVDEWTRVGIRLRVVKDVRRLIGELIWEDRQNATYVISSQKPVEFPQVDVSKFTSEAGEFFGGAW